MARSARQAMFEGMELLPAPVIPFDETSACAFRVVAVDRNIATK